MAKKSKAVDINITGHVQAEEIGAAFDAKTKADMAKLIYDRARDVVMGTMLGKVFSHWAKAGAKNVGSYNFVLPDGEVRNVTVQNNQSRKSYDPADAKAMLEILNRDIPPAAQIKGSDVFVIVKKFAIDNESMAIPKVRDRVIAALTELEARLKADGDMPPEISLLNTERKLVPAPHALDRLLAVSGDFPSAMHVLGDPVSISLITKKPELADKSKAAK